MNIIPYGRQWIDPEDIQEVCNVLNSDWLTQGPAITLFEDSVATYCGARHAIAVSSATAALHISCLALGLGPGDYVWTSPNTFVASANCALYCGAQVDFVDIDLSTYNMCVYALEEKLIHSEKIGTLPKIVIPVHFAGNSCDMTRIKKLSDKYGFRIIEDASHAIGGLYKNEKIGNCRYSDVTVFSFHPVKLITTGEGGVVLTNDPNLNEILLRLRTHGITKNTKEMAGEVHGPWYYEQLSLGFNYRITDIQAALGKNQLKKLDKFLSLRRNLVSQYHIQMATLPIKLPQENIDNKSAWHLYAIMVNLEELNSTRLKIFEHMRAANIGVNVHYIPVYFHPYYRKNGFDKSKFSNAEYYYERALTLPLYPSMTAVDQERVIANLKAACV